MYRITSKRIVEKRLEIEQAVTKADSEYMTDSVVAELDFTYNQRRDKNRLEIWLQVCQSSRRCTLRAIFISTKTYINSNVW